jgi:hypothetical protein
MAEARNCLERWLDRHNHTMELLRKVVAFIVLTPPIIILVRLLGY